MIIEVYENEAWVFPTIVYRPEKMEGKLPVIIQLHGAGEVGDGGEELVIIERHGISNLLKAGKEYPCIIVMLQCPSVSLGMARYGRLQPVDTTGAGDIFGGSAVSRLLELNVAPETLSEEQLAYVGSFASTAASLSTEKQGGIPSIPNEEVVKKYL